MTPAPPFSELHADILADAIRRIRSAGIAVTPTDETGIGNALVSPIRAALIRSEYKAGREAGVKSEALQVELAEKYGISYGAVHHVLFEPDRY